MRRTYLWIGMSGASLLLGCRGTETAAPTPLVVKAPRLQTAADSLAFQNSTAYGQSASTMSTATVVTGLQLQIGDYLSVTVSSTDCSGDPETVTVGGVITGTVFSASCLTLPGTQKVIGPATAYGTVYFVATHPEYGAGPRGSVSGTEPDYSVGLNDGYGDTDYNDVILSVSLTSAPPSGACEAPPLLISPVVTDPFKAVDPLHPNPHMGRDYRAPTGTPVYAVEAGVVKHRALGVTSGNAIVVVGTTRISYYYHLQSFAVQLNQTVAAGDLLGYSDNTGHSNASHLHFEQHALGPIWKPNGKADRATVLEPCTF
jgi:hypothetical protein